MVASLCLLSGLLAPAQVRPPSPPGLSPLVERRAPAPAGDYLLTPRLNVGQELVYRGTFTEQSGAGQVQLNRTYRIETRAFVLEAGTRGVDLAVLTLLRDQAVAGSLKPGEQGEVRSARLERIGFDMQGKPIAPAGVSLSVPVEGPPLVECGFCVAVPTGRLGMEKPWTASEPGRPDTTWHVAGTEVACGASCMRLEGTQQSDNWGRPGGKPAWRRQDTVWVSPRTGVAQRVERRIEYRAAGHEEPDHVSVLSYDQQSALRFPTTLADDRRRELIQTLQLQQSVRPILSQPGRYGAQIDIVLARVKATHNAHADTPYREALAHLRSRLEMAKRGEIPPDIPSELALPDSHEEPQRLAAGKTAPDFVAAEMNVSGRAQGLRKWRGHPTLLVFFNPDSHCLNDMMETLQALADRHKEIALVGLAMSGEPGKVDDLRTRRGWKMPILSGTGLRITYAVKCTPKLVFIDGDGVVQGVVEGWGSETAEEISACLPRWIGR